MLTRRSFLAGLITAPAIVHAGNLMPVRLIESQIGPFADPEIIAMEHFLKAKNLMENSIDYWMGQSGGVFRSCYFDGRLIVEKIPQDLFFTGPIEAPEDYDYDPR